MRSEKHSKLHHIENSVFPTGVHLEDRKHPAGKESLTDEDRKSLCFLADFVLFAQRLMMSSGWLEEDLAVQVDWR